MTSYTRTKSISSDLADGYENLRIAFEKLGVKMDSPSMDGFLRRILFPDGRKIFFTANALPLNCASAVSLAHDKLATYQVLIEEGIAIPKGIAFFASEFHRRQTQAEPQLLLENLPSAILEHFPDITAANFKVIIKPGQGRCGYMVNICKTLFEIQSFARDILTSFHYGLIQEYINGPEYRVVILDENPIIIYQKCLSRLEKGENDNPVRGDTGISIELAKAPFEVIEIAKKAHRALGLRFSGIDVCLPQNIPPAIVLEVNSSPGFDALEDDFNFDAEKLAGIIAKAVLAT